MTGKTAGDRKIRKLARFASRHKIIASAVLVLMVLMVGNTIHAVANPETGFFFWMKRDDSGIKMLTSPEKLDNKVNEAGNTFYNKEDAPEWAQSWLQIEEKIKMPENYEWKNFEVNELDIRNVVIGKYWNNVTQKQIVLGVWIYINEISYLSEEYIDYDYIQSYEVDQKQIDIYSREEKEGVYYIVSFFDRNCQYYVRGEDNIDELKKIIEEYWRCVKNNS